MKKIFKTLCCVLCLLTLTICCGNIQFKAVYAEAVTMDLSAKSCYVMDYYTNTVVYEKNKDLRLPVASMVKLMTILLTFEELDKGNLTYEEEVTTTENASSMGGSQVFIDPFVNYKVSDLIKSVVMASANDASVALAEKISGSEEAFVEKMNSRAIELNLLNTKYVNATGLPAPEQYSSSYDTALLLKEVIKHENYHNYSTVWMDELVHPSGRKTELVNTNKLIRYYKGCDSGKTGSTTEAGYCLASSAKKDNMRLISVVIGAKNGQARFNESSTLLNYGFANFENKSIISKDVALFNSKLTKAKEDSVEVFAAEEYKAFMKKGDKGNYEVKYDINDKLKAPMKSGQVVGKVLVIKDGEIIYTTNLIVKQDIQSIGFKDSFNKIVDKW